MMVARLSRKYPEDDAEPLAVTPIDWAKVREWQEEALRLRQQGLGIRKIAAAVGKCYSQVQRLVIPGGHEKAMRRKAEREKERRAEDPAYAEKIRTYVRKYEQLVAPKRWTGRRKRESK